MGSPRAKAKVAADYPELAELKVRHTAYDRSKIRVAELINRLTNCGLGYVDMTPSAVTAAVAVLKKALPDLTSVEVTGDTHDRVRIYAEVPRPIADLAEWMKGNPVKSTNLVEIEAQEVSKPQLQGILSLTPVQEEDAAAQPEPEEQSGS